jgi:hypothetical protein
MAKLLIIFLISNIFIGCGKKNEKGIKSKNPINKINKGTLAGEINTTKSTIKLDNFSQIEFIIKGQVKLEKGITKRTLFKKVKVISLKLKCFQNKFLIEETPYIEITNENVDDYFDIVYKGYTTTLAKLNLRKHKVINKSAPNQIDINLKEKWLKKIPKGQTYDGNFCELMRRAGEISRSIINITPKHYLDMQYTISTSQE